MSILEELEIAIQQAFHSNGDVPVTLGHLLEIVRVTRRRQIAKSEAHEHNLDALYNESDPLGQGL